MSDDATTNQTGEKSDSQRGGGNKNRRRGGGHAPKKRPPEQSLNLNELRELADLVTEHGFTDFEFENENIRVRLSKNLAPQIIQTSAAPVQTTAPSAAAPSKSAGETEAADEERTVDDDLQTITSPIVGTLYRAPSPDKSPYVKEGEAIILPSARSSASSRR